MYSTQTGQWGWGLYTALLWLSPLSQEDSESISTMCQTQKEMPSNMNILRLKHSWECKAVIQISSSSLQI